MVNENRNEKNQKGTTEIGRALAKFYDSRHKDVFLRLALRAIKVFDLDCGRIHHDTISVSRAP